jgi:hypothetical protein
MQCRSNPSNHSGVTISLRTMHHRGGSSSKLTNLSVRHVGFCDPRTLKCRTKQI